MAKFHNIPEASYGVLQQDQFQSELDEAAEQVRRLGYAILDAGYSAAELKEFSDEFNRTRLNYVQVWGEQRLRSLNEFDTIRAPLTHGGPAFMQLAMNSNLITVLKNLIVGKFILNQQNGIINPPGEAYSQGAWHRDLPYQHFVSSSPLAVNALFCVDDFTSENGSTFVLPASHKAVTFPSASYIKRNAVQVEAKAGQYILLDCMLFHSGGFNRTGKARRAVNHVYNIPYFKQQINIPKNIASDTLSASEKEILGLNYQESESIEQYFSLRDKKRHA